ncbi:MAG: ABC transporter substrate-binding protein [Clostridiales bacterium]|nr:ABC transporter substrate-binding protein [Clostridiales bacterium]
MKKRILCAVTALAAAVSMTAGCSKQETTAMKDDQSQPYEIEWYFPGSFGADQDMVNEKANEYLKEKLNVTLKLMPLDWGVYVSKTSNMINSGEKMDLVWTDISHLPNYVNQQIPVQIDELMDEYAPETKAMLGEDFLEGAKIDHKLYAIPANKEKAHGTTIVYRKDIADKYGFDMSKVHTIEDMYPYFDILKEKEPGMVCFGANHSGSTPVSVTSDGINFYNVGGADLVMFSDSEPDKIICKYESESYKNAVKNAAYMHEKGYIDPDVAIKDNFSELKTNGDVFCWKDVYHPTKLEELNKSYDYELGQVLITDITSDATDAMGSLLYIPYTCENPVRVMKFVELFNTDPYLNNLINFGIEGVHYEKTGENTIKTLDKINDYDFVGSQWELGNTMINYILDGYSTDRYEKLNAFNDEIEYSKYYGFMFNMEEVDTEVTACQSVVSEYWKNLDFGSAADWETELAGFLDKLNKAGLEDVKAAAQRQYDEWKKTE